MGQKRSLLIILAGVWLLILATLSQGWPAEMAVAASSCFGHPSTIMRLTSKGAINGTPHADVIITGSGADVIDGRGGNDLICSGAGSDRIRGDTGSDRIDAGTGEDLVEAGNGSDRVSGGVGSDTLIGERGNDLLLAGPGSRDFADGGLGDDTLFGGSGGHDQLIGGVGNDQLHGGPGEGDVLRGDHGRDLFDGGPGAHDTASFAASGFTGANSFGGTGVTVNLGEGRATQDGTDHLHGIEDVIGSPFRDSITGDVQPNALYGAGGDDRLIADGASDAAHGGGGSDICEGFAAEESCGPEPGIDTAAVEADLAGGTIGSSLSAVVRVPAPTPSLGLRADIQGSDMRVRFEDGAWLLREEPLPVVVGDSCTSLGRFEARCPVIGKPDAILVDGSAGNDLIEINASTPSYVSSFIDGEAGDDALIGGPGADNLVGAPAASEHPTDSLFGRGGDDSLANAAVFKGGSGSDLLIAAPCGGQAVSGGAGVDSVSFARSTGHIGVAAALGGIAVYAPGSAGITGGAGGCPSPTEEPTRIDDTVERIEGSRWDDVLIGDAAPNNLLGRSGEDRMEGHDGDDILVGGEGRDQFFGGPGFDRLFAADGGRDRLLNCGEPANGLALVDSFDPPARHCSRIRSDRGSAAE